MGGKASNKNANIARYDEQQRQDKIRAGTERVGGIFDSNFNDDFFKGRRDAFTNYATPQLEDQYADAQKQLTFSLDRAGTLDSSIRAEKAGELQKLYDTNKQQVADQALTSETDARNAVEGARTDLLQMLNVTGDAEGAANSAISRATALSQPQTFSPLTKLFSDFTSGLGQQAAQERAAAMSGGSYVPKYNTGLFGVPTGSVKNS